MDGYAALLEKTRVPQPALQKYAVISLFSNLRSAPLRLSPDSEPGRHAISQCLCSPSPHVMDQAVRELCSLVIDGRLDFSDAFQELISAMEMANATSSPLFVKAFGFLIRLGFLRNIPEFEFTSSESHPIVKMILCGAEVQEVVKEVALFIKRCKDKGMNSVCEFLRPFLYFTIFHGSLNGSTSYDLTSNLCCAMTYFCCSSPDDAFPLLTLLASCFKFLPRTNRVEFMRSFSVVEHVVEAYLTWLKLLSSSQSKDSITAAQYFGIELAESILSLFTTISCLYGCSDLIPNLLKRLFEVHKELELSYVYEMRSVQVSLLTTLLQSNHEHQHISIVKLINFLFKWKYECGDNTSQSAYICYEDLLLLMHMIYLISSGTKALNTEATSYVTMLESYLISFFMAPKDVPDSQFNISWTDSLGSIVYRSFQNLKIQDNSAQLPSFLFFVFSSETSFVEGLRKESSFYYIHVMKEYCLHLVHKKKSSSLSTFDKTILVDFPQLLSWISGALVFYQPTRDVALDIFISVGIMEPGLGVAHLLAIFFFCNVFSQKGVDDCKTLTKLLSVLPSLVTHSAMIPLVIQAIKSMIKKDSKPVLHSTGIRLLCKSWEYNDRAFGMLFEVLRADTLEKLELKKDVCLSWAASVRDVCRKNPDRGVDIILSVSSCIESRDNQIRALGFQSLSHLCEGDVIDFYTAWAVVSKHLTDYTSDPILARSVCLFIRWGSLDAEAYQENLSSVLGTVWNILTCSKGCRSKSWTMAKISALYSLRQYEVPLLENLLPEFKAVVNDMIFFEKDTEVLKEIEYLQTKIISHEHNTRPRHWKGKTISRSKIAKLLDVLPQVLFPFGWRDAQALPGAALICLSEVRMDVSLHEKTPSKIHSKYAAALSEIISSIILSRNIFLALFSLQSWKVFLPSWMATVVATVNATSQSHNAADKTKKVAKEILQSLVYSFEGAIPRSSENVLLSVGAFCWGLPASLQSVKSEASKFMLNQLFEYEHEHRQWSAAISLGLISRHLDKSHYEQKFEIIDALFQVLNTSRSTFVRGACATALGIACQCFLKRMETSDDNEPDQQASKLKETTLLHKVVFSLLNMVNAISPGSSIVKDCLEFIPLTKESTESCTFELFQLSCENFEEDIWGIAGLVIGLGYCLDAIYRSGSLVATLNIKKLIISSIINSMESLEFSNEIPSQYVCLGACYAIPSVIAFCRKVEIMTDWELDSVLDALSSLISKLLSVPILNAFQQLLLMTSCVVAGEVMYFILTEGVWYLDANRVKNILELYRKCYLKSYHPTIQLGGMVGFANALGCGVGMVYDRLYSSLTTPKESIKFDKSLLISLVGEPYITEMVQELFLVAQNCDDIRLQQSASWVVSFLRSCWQAKTKYDFGEGSSLHHNYPENSSVMQLSLWLSNLKASEDDHYQADTAVTVLRCLTGAPRLPLLDWGLIIRKCMRFEEQEYYLKKGDLSLASGILREQCILFSIAHANHFDTLLYFLEELSELSRFKTLSLNLQRCLLIHMSGLKKTFSDSKFGRMLYDVMDIFRQNTSEVEHESEADRFLRISCWDGLHDCFNEASEISCDVESIFDCLEILFSCLSIRECSLSSGGAALNSIEEWCAAIKCLAKIPNERLLKFLHTNWEYEDVHSSGFLKKVIAKAKLVRVGSLPLTELNSFKTHILNYQSDEIWGVLVEVAAAVHSGEGAVKRQWLVDTVQISSVSCYPSTAMRFLGLLCGGFCKYAPFLLIERTAVLSDLPVTLPCLLSESSWNVVAEAAVIGLWRSTERIYHWITATGVHSSTPNEPLLHENKDQNTAFLFRVMHRVCVALTSYLPMENQLSLANMLIPEM